MWKYVSVAAFLFAAASPAADVKPGSIKARWPIKTSVPDGTDLSKRGTLVSLSDFLALKAAAEHASTDFQEKRYDKVAGAKVGEGQIVRTRGYLRVVAPEDDGDFHIQISETNTTFENCLVVEVPKDDPDFVKGSKEANDVIAAAKDVRDWVMKNILTDGNATVGHVYAIKGPAFVEVTGQLFFDSEHQAAQEKGVFRGKSIPITPGSKTKKQLPSHTAWEIHPITKIAFVKPQ